MPVFFQTVPAKRKRVRCARGAALCSAVRAKHVLALRFRARMLRRRKSRGGARRAASRMSVNASARLYGSERLCARCHFSARVLRAAARHAQACVCPRARVYARAVKAESVVW